MVANELTAMVTTTFARSVSDAFAAAEMTLWLRRCRDARDPFPFLWTLDRGSKRGRVHGHLLLPASLASLVEGQWPHGHIQVDVGANDWESLRQRAGYLTKAFDTPVLGGQRYRRVKGFQPESVTIDARWEITYRADLTMRHPRTNPTRHPEFFFHTAHNRVWLAHRALPLPLAVTYVLNWTLITVMRNATQPNAAAAHLRGTLAGVRERPGPRRPVRWGTIVDLARRGRPPVI